MYFHLPPHRPFPRARDTHTHGDTKEKSIIKRYTQRYVVMVIRSDFVTDIISIFHSIRYFYVLHFYDPSPALFDSIVRFYHRSTPGYYDIVVENYASHENAQTNDDAHITYGKLIAERDDLVKAIRCNPKIFVENESTHIRVRHEARKQGKQIIGIEPQSHDDVCCLSIAQAIESMCSPLCLTAIIGWCVVRRSTFQCSMIYGCSSVSPVEIGIHRFQRFQQKSHIRFAINRITEN